MTPEDFADWVALKLLQSLTSIEAAAWTLCGVVAFAAAANLWAVLLLRRDKRGRARGGEDA